MIGFDEQCDRFEFKEETKMELDKYDDDNIAFVCITGEHHTGKSFLLNRLLSLKGKDIFKVSSTANASTKGIWIWSKPI